LFLILFHGTSMIDRYWAACGKLWTLLNLAVPMVSSAGIWELARITNLFFVGRLNGAKYIGAATLGTMMCNITGYSVMNGMGTALDSLLSQAYGAKSYNLVGLYAQRAMVGTPNRLRPFQYFFVLFAFAV
jgi:Na+-driven multidrug efflux pump